MNTSNIMKEQGLRYFSSLTPIQKDKTINHILKLKYGINDLHPLIADRIIKALPWDEIIKNLDYITAKIKSQKMFNHEGNFYPLNFKEIQLC